MRLATADELRLELADLVRFHRRRFRAGAHSSRLTDRARFTQSPPLGLARCDGCGSVYRDPTERGDHVTETYAAERVDPETLRALFDAQLATFRRRARRLTRLARGTGRGLEIGSYHGAFLAAARAEGWAFEGLDVNASAVRFARGMGLPVRRGSLDDAPRPATYDAIAIWNCFEQLPDPRAALRSARILLPAGGWLVLRVPNAAFYTRLRPLLGGPWGPLAWKLLAHSNLLGFPYRCAFTREALASMLAKADFEIVLARGGLLLPLRSHPLRYRARAGNSIIRAMLSVAVGCRLPPWFELYARRRG